MRNDITIRTATDADRDFIFELSPCLAEVANLSWHDHKTMHQMQDVYITQTLAQTDKAKITLIAEMAGHPMGYIHACAHQDDISKEPCGLIPLLAVSPKAQGTGVGQLLMNAAQDWAKAQGFRLLHLEVFANNTKARHFYQKQGFEEEMVRMVKTL